MAAVEPLIDSAFWESEEALVLSEDDRLSAWLDDQSALRGHVLFATSGSTGKSKYVSLSKAALAASAKMINQHLEACAADRWLVSLPKHHVGGFGVAARAWFTKATLYQAPKKWDPWQFCETLRSSEITLTSLVPTQLFDLVQARLSPSPSLRAVLIGGGALSPSLEEEARALGWPILKTYGMTETASQVATQPLGSVAETPLQVLPDWKTDTTSEGLLKVRGAALFSGYVSENDGDFVFTAATGAEGWFTTSDMVNLQGRTLHFLSRAAERLKIKGELVNLAALRENLSEVARQLQINPATATLLPVENPRDGCALILVTTQEDPSELHEIYNAQAPGLVQVKAAVSIPKIPRTALGKIDESTLRRVVDPLTSDESLS